LSFYGDFIFNPHCYNVEVQDRDIILGQLESTVDKLQQLELNNEKANWTDI